MTRARHVSGKRNVPARPRARQRVWRWHFMAGLMVIPFAIILAVTGAIYLFKPQFEAAVEARINQRAMMLAEETLPADRLLASALETYPGAAMMKYVIATSPDDPTVEIDLRTEAGPRTLWIDRSSGEVLHDTSTPGRFMNVVKRIHGTLLAGDAGSLVVEIMASWMIILIVTGVFLWWPRGVSGWRFFIPDVSPLRGRRELFRRLHGTLGAWAGGLILVMLISGLPWTQVWGAGYGMAKQAMGLKEPGQEWFVTLTSSDPHAHHGGGTGTIQARLSGIVADIMAAQHCNRPMLAKAQSRSRWKQSIRSPGRRSIRPLSKSSRRVEKTVSGPSVRWGRAGPAG